TSGSPSGAGESVEGDMGDEAEPDGAAEEPAGLTPTTPSPANPSPSPTPDPGADEPSDAGGLDLTWLWWTGGILLLIIVAGGVTLVVRRP
ncbi:MAG TPA: hypothetical protein PK890_04350, partial [Terrimesophilobacter sp.]|nr:hypothetical protein [Terrimesophilobacter sp.]